ncbi:MAG: hypothetical protein ACE5DK_04210 [Paracoccaceae bacterium]
MAQSVEENVMAAINYVVDGKSADSRAAMQNAAADLWLQAPLAFSKAIFVSRETVRFGAYDERPDNVFEHDEPLLVYAEPVSYGWRKEGDFHVTDLVVDAALLSDGGQTLWKKEAFGRFNLKSRYRMMEFLLNLRLDVDGLTAGNYVLQYKVTDKVRDNSATIELPFVAK